METIEKMQARYTATCLLLLILSACAQVAPTPLPIETLQSATTSAVTEAQTTPTEGICPTETTDLKLFTNAEDGYCLLYPAEDTTIPPALIVIDPTGMPGDMPGNAWMQIITENASGRTAAQVADSQIAEAGEGFNITRSEILMDGKTAVVVDGLPGQDPSRKVFIVGNDRLYTFFFTPWVPNAEGFSQLEKLYTTVVDSFHLLPAMP